ncbi:MAG TPA: ABC transporter permease [Bacilli bacterium]|nr:ABC transporter permease [Bacilli bacterium]HQA55869.1 ABC transporter permease [Bacilli bacterium]
MRKYVLQRLLLAFITAFIILSLTYILVAALPIIGTFGKASSMFAYYQDQVRLGYALDFPVEQTGYGTRLWYYVDSTGIAHYWYKRPILELYFNWLKNIITKWDWGRSTQIKLNASAISIIMQRLPVSMYLNIISVIFSVPLGILLGIWAGLKKNTWIDHTISTLVMIFISIPSFVVITFMIWIFGYQLGWLPTQWPSTIMPVNTKVLGYIIPVFALSFGSICGYTRFVRAELCEVMSSEYLLLARTKGLTKNQAIVRHALRNAFVPILPSILAEFIGILGGSMILESIYGIPGIGFLYISALNTKDYSVLMVDMAVFTLISLVAGIVLDLSYGFIDPRIRMGAKK